MTLMLNLSPELEQYLTRSAQERGVSVEELTLAMLLEQMLDVTQDLIPAGASCEVWSPYDAFDAAKIMMQALQDSGVDNLFCLD
jgi:hypothetical protein